MLLIIWLFDVHFAIQGLKMALKLKNYPEICEIESVNVTKEDKDSEKLAKKWI